jgi:predicted nucleotidyltransferase component of viral defense system
MTAHFERLDLPRRRRFCEEAAARLGLPGPSVEKDYWVCWTLRALFSSPGVGEHLTFKGGTSLAKGWDLIERFSEDIDVVIDRGSLGFAGEAGPTASGISNKERERRLDRLLVASAAHTEVVLMACLSRALVLEVVDVEDWTVTLDPDDKQRQTILLEYPSQFAEAYVRNVVKVELGARSDTEPRERIRVRSHLAKALVDEVEEPESVVLAVSPHRTFLEKVMLLHEEGYRDEDAALNGRMSRHLYDVVRLAEAGIGERALEDPGLFERVAEHRRVFFARNRAAHSTLHRGQLRLVPRGERLDRWREDYRRMQDAMFWREPPTFDHLVASLRSVETRMNASF